MRRLRSFGLEGAKRCPKLPPFGFEEVSTEGTCRLRLANPSGTGILSAMPSKPHSGKRQARGEAPKGGERWTAKEAWKNLPGNRYTPEELAIMGGSDFLDIRFGSPQIVKTTVAI